MPAPRCSEPRQRRAVPKREEDATLSGASGVRERVHRLRRDRYTETLRKQVQQVRDDSREVCSMMVISRGRLLQMVAIRKGLSDRGWSPSIGPL